MRKRSCDYGSTKEKSRLAPAFFMLAEEGLLLLFSRGSRSSSVSRSGRSSVSRSSRGSVSRSGRSSISRSSRGSVSRSGRSSSRSGFGGRSRGFFRLRASGQGSGEDGGEEEGLLHFDFLGCWLQREFGTTPDRASDLDQPKIVARASRIKLQRWKQGFTSQALLCLCNMNNCPRSRRIDRCSRRSRQHRRASACRASAHDESGSPRQPSRSA